MQANYVQRLRLTFSKQGPARFIGHLDLARTLERSINRAGIPIAYTQGFNRRPRLSIAAALPLGYTSDYELADIWLAEELEPEVVKKVMMSRMAPGVIISCVENIALSAPSLQSKITAGTYEAHFLDQVAFEDLKTRIKNLLAAKIITRRRSKGGDQGKEYDLRPLIITLQAAPNHDGTAHLEMKLSLLEGKTGRPDEVVAALDFEPQGTRINRTEILLSDDS